MQEALVDLDTNVFDTKDSGLPATNPNAGIDMAAIDQLKHMFCDKLHHPIYHQQIPNHWLEEYIESRTICNDRREVANVHQQCFSNAIPFSPIAFPASHA